MLGITHSPDYPSASPRDNQKLVSYMSPTHKPHPELQLEKESGAEGEEEIGDSQEPVRIIV